MVMNSLLFALIGALLSAHVLNVTGKVYPVPQNSDDHNNNNQNIEIRINRRAQPQLSCDQCYECLCHHAECDNEKRFIFNTISTALHNRERCKPYGIDCHGRQDGGWASWTGWTDCTGPCDQPSRTRTRQCSNPAPKNCGEQCHGRHLKTDHTCTPAACTHHAPITLSTTTKTPETTVTMTTTPTTTTATTTPTTTTPPPPPTTTTKPTTVASTTTAEAFTSCSKLCAVSAVANQIPVFQANTKQCAGNSTGSNEALPLHCCGDLDRRLTQPGTNVMARCDTFPHYTAVASFTGGSVEAGTEGIFISCLPAPEVGFQLIRQDCNTLPDLVHVNMTQVVYGSPYGYFALV